MANCFITTYQMNFVWHPPCKKRVYPEEFKLNEKLRDPKRFYEHKVTAISDEEAKATLKRISAARYKSTYYVDLCEKFDRKEEGEHEVGTFADKLVRDCNTLFGPKKYPILQPVPIKRKLMGYMSDIDFFTPLTTYQYNIERYACDIMREAVKKEEAPCNRAAAPEKCGKH